MMRSIGRRRLALAGICLALVCGCNLTRVAPAQDGILPSPLPPTPVPTAEGDWKTVVPGVERRTMDVNLSGALDTEAVVVRLDPALVTFRVHYSPDQPLSLNDWYNALPEPAVIANAAFFDENNRALGLLVQDGQFFGQSFSGFGGMFQVTADGVRVRSLVSEPYQGETLIQAVQAFPMLIEAGGIMAPQSEGFDQRSRRTLIGQDWSGRIVLAVIPRGTVSLADLQAWLLGSDLGLYIAFALDGGRSTGMGIYGPRNRDLYPALDQLPSVIAVYGP
jgi:hypothetical protein